jgi:hypothetical protein
MPHETPPAGGVFIGIVNLLRETPMDGIEAVLQN